MTARLSLLLAALLAAAAAGPNPAGHANGAVAAVSPPAVDVGVEILKRGGNAVDAAVAVGFAQAVTWPAAGNVGGGGFMMVHPGRAGKPAAPVCVEYRETAPAAAARDMFVQEEDWYSHRSAGVPGTVRGFALAHAEFGKLPWRDVVAPAVKLAADGFVIEDGLAGSLNGLLAGCDDERTAETRRVFGKPGGGDWRAGDRLVQPDLAKTLRHVMDRGPEGFYAGPVADLVAAEMTAGGGLITKADLARYEAKLREPVRGTYRGYDVYGPPPPSSGGVTLVLMLNMLEAFGPEQLDRRTARGVHLTAEVMRRAYLERARHLGDPDFAPAPAHLTTKEFARKLAGTIDPDRATRSAALAPDLPLAKEGNSTTHYSVIDPAGMAVSNTYTLERSYGSRITVRGAGFLLNNEMLDFNPKPGVTDATGRVGTRANEVAPGKRMLSSQTPTILAKDGKVFLVIGSPGGRTIINTTLCVVTNVVDRGMTVQEAVDAPRLHHQWLPDELKLERTPDSAGLVKALEVMGHKVSGSRQGDAHSILVDPRTGRYVPAADGRIIGKAAGW